MVDANVLKALKACVAAFDALQLEGPAGPTVVAAVNEARIAIAKVQIADDL